MQQIHAILVLTEQLNGDVKHRQAQNSFSLQHCTATGAPKGTTEKSSPYHLEITVESHPRYSHL